MASARPSGDHCGGSLGQNGAGEGWPGQLLSATVSPSQALYGCYRDFLVVHGKEKVYGSIP
jgi:hypothetical protein